MSATNVDLLKRAPGTRDNVQRVATGLCSSVRGQAIARLS